MKEKLEKISRIATKFINKKIPKFNDKSDPVIFNNEKELWKFVKTNKIDDMQEFWFIVRNEPI